MKAKVILLVAVALVFLSFISYPWGKNQQISPKIEQQMQKTMKIGETTLNIEVADTDAERIQGLSGKTGLGENEGMLFIFEKEGNYAFWMKDMKFPIDIAWLDKDKKIVFIENAVEPATYPKAFGSSVLSLYVLETNAGFFEKNGIKIGDIAEF
jgi:uncharacterized protein